jgi:hypothetical protein
MGKNENETGRFFKETHHHNVWTVLWLRNLDRKATAKTHSGACSLVFGDDPWTTQTLKESIEKRNVTIRNSCDVLSMYGRYFVNVLTLEMTWTALGTYTSEARR